MTMTTLTEMFISSCSMIVLYSRDHKGMGMAHKKTSPKNLFHLSLTMMKQYWLQTQTSLQIDLKCFQQVAMKFKKILN